MTKPYTILQKKLQELESQLATIYSFPTHIPVPEHLVQDSHQRLDFLRRFLAAEVASRPSKPRHLAHISRRLDHLDANFRAWQDHHAAPPDDADADAGSACSCTESCLNDDGDVASDPGDAGLAIVEYYNEETASLKDRNAELFSDCLGPEVGEDEERIGLSRGGNRRVVVFGTMGFVGFVLIMLVVLFGWFGYGSYDRRFQKFLTPT